MNFKIEKTEALPKVSRYRSTAIEMIENIKPGENTFIKISEGALEIRTAICVYKNTNNISNKMFITRKENDGIRFYRVD